MQKDNSLGPPASISFLSYLAIFYVSFLCIILELFFTRMLSLKAWNHVVYIVIPFAILGYGIGANIQLFLHERFKQVKIEKAIGLMVFFTSLLSLLSAVALIKFPLNVDYVLNIFSDFRAVGMLLWAYTIFMIPFVLIGCLVVYLFLLNPSQNHRLYFYDLLGAGIAAILFFYLINTFAVIRSIALISILGMFLALLILFPKRKILSTAITIALAVGVLFFMVEPLNYRVDQRKGWEWIPGFFDEKDYKQVSSRWHPLGRTDIYRILGQPVYDFIFRHSQGTFEINLEPRPELAYISTNFLAGTPVYQMSSFGLKEKNSKVALFSQSMEAPYLLVKEPRVLVIGAGGGRDIFMAKTHEAKKVIGAEINPGIVEAMSKGGVMYEYSGRVYDLENTKVHKIDGRHLVKKLQPNSIDLIILNGVDTFSGLSSGAYAYAESYLYTKNAVMDYFRVLSEGGVINFNRWFFTDMPRETLRLHAITLDALKSMGVQKPWDHIIVGTKNGWSLMLIKKTPYTDEEYEKVKNYFHKHDVFFVYPSERDLKLVNHPWMMFDVYAERLRNKKHQLFAYSYPFDISVITDDNPFFYKYYKLNSFNPFKPLAVHHTGPIIFMTQFLIFLQAFIFILLFIFLPLVIFKKRGIKALPEQAIQPFIVYFSCLGIGFMFIEIPVMQKFVLLLGSPIYSITVVLAAILISTGVGSLLLPHFNSRLNRQNLIIVAAFVLLIYIFGLIYLGAPISNQSMSLPFWGRVVLVTGLIFPLGILLGVFFPSGLNLVSKSYPDTIPWAWGLNCGFSVLGSILSIIFAQFLGFNAILMLAAVTYLTALLAYQRLVEYF